MKGKKQYHIPPKLSKFVTRLKEFESTQRESEWAIWAFLKAQNWTIWTDGKRQLSSAGSDGGGGADAMLI